ncbi:MAG: AAA family ATPase, partial [Nocardioides sp.]
MDGLFEYETSGDRGSGVPAGSLAGNDHASAPLAVRMRPRTLDELIGQPQLRAEGSPLRRLVESDQSMSLLLWGPPGTGKTTIAAIVSQQSKRRFVEVSATSAGVKDVRAAIDRARTELTRRGHETVLFVDEVHRFTKAQQDALLPGVENRWVTLIAATTENPFFSVISPLLSRSLLLRLESLTDSDIDEVLTSALKDERGLAGRVDLDEDARTHLVRLAGGDARRALTYLEAAAGAAADKRAASVDLATAETAVDQAAVRYDR